MPSPLSESAIIALIRSYSPPPSLLGDDCAILRPPANHELLVTTDFSLEGRHFRRTTNSPESIAHRTLARGLSDLAAMGATPLAAFLSLALPPALAADRAWLKRFFAGFHALAGQHDTPLAGGDTSQSPADLVLADICLLGTAPRGRALLRSTAQPGDLLYVTGALGGAAAELRSLSKKSLRLRSTANHPHLFPQPRLAVGHALLRRRLATSCIDLSDGLSTDLAHLCTESHLHAELEAAAIPIHALANKQLALALHGGEDYELLFTASPRTKIPKQIAGTPITRIGTMHRPRRNHPQLTLLNPDAPNGKRIPLQPSGFEHFRGHVSSK